MKRLHLKDAIPICRFCGSENAYRMFLGAGPKDAVCPDCMFKVLGNAQQSNRPTSGKDGT